MTKLLDVKPLNNVILVVLLVDYIVPLRRNVKHALSHFALKMRCLDVMQPPVAQLVVETTPVVLTPVLSQFVLREKSLIRIRPLIVLVANQQLGVPIVVPSKNWKHAKQPTRPSNPVLLVLLQLVSSKLVVLVASGFLQSTIALKPKKRSALLESFLFVLLIKLQPSMPPHVADPVFVLRAPQLLLPPYVPNKISKIAH
jgi:hypothetical protein